MGHSMEKLTSKSVIFLGTSPVICPALAAVALLAQGSNPDQALFVDDYFVS